MLQTTDFLCSLISYFLRALYDRVNYYIFIYYRVDNINPNKGCVYVDNYFITRFKGTRIEF